MGIKKTSKSSSRKNKKLALSKSTVRDLSPKEGAQRMVGGGKGIRTRQYYEC
jgi:hypothetical protein